jgi:hypothetical protein
LINRVKEARYGGPFNQKTIVFERYLYEQGNMLFGELYALAKRYGYSQPYVGTTKKKLEAFLDEHLMVTVEVAKETEEPRRTKRRRLAKVWATDIALLGVEKGRKEEVDMVEVVNAIAAPLEKKVVAVEKDVDMVDVIRVITGLEPVAKMKKEKKKRKQPYPLMMKTIEEELTTKLKEPLAAGHALSIAIPLEYDFTLTELHRLCNAIVQRVLTTTLAEFKFSVKAVLYGDLVNTETGERKVDFPCYFPKDRYEKVHSKTDATKYGKAFDVYLGSFTEAEQIYPSTKWKYDAVRKLGFLINKQHTGGCAKHANLTRYGRSLKNPDNVDDLCFWRCVVIQLLKHDSKSIGKRNSKEQREQAQHWKLQAEQALGMDMNDKVALDDVPKIADALKLLIQVYTLSDDGEEEQILMYDGNDEHRGHPGVRRLFPGCYACETLGWIMRNYLLYYYDGYHVRG